MHMLLLPYAISLTHKYTRRVRRQTFLSPTRSHVCSCQACFHGNLGGEGVNERLCDCVSTTKSSPVPAAARRTGMLSALGASAVFHITEADKLQLKLYMF